MRLALAVQGRLDKALAHDERLLATAVTDGVTATGEALKRDLRLQIVRAGLGERLSKSWRGRAFPGRGKVSFDAAYQVRSAAPDVVRGHEGAVIRGREGQWLAIPTENVPRVPGGRGARRRMTPVEVEAAFNQDLIVRPAKGRRALVAYVRGNVSRKTGRGRALTRRQRAAGKTGTLIAMFVLVPQVRLRKRLDVARARNAAERRLGREIAFQVNRALASAPLKGAAP